MSIFIETIDPIDNFGKLTNNQRLFKFYLNKRGVKFPNNFHIYANEWFGPNIKKLLKKTDNRMVDAVMLYRELSGKQIKKALHNCDDLNIYPKIHTKIENIYLKESIEDKVIENKKKLNK
jgi:hypothetical protein